MSGYRGRFAPSPTGQLHLGLARTALIAWLRARSEGGAFVLRMEDIDTPRVVRGSAARQLDDLGWLGIDWDEGPDVGGPFAPYVQSERTARYEAAIAELRAQGRIYDCSCSRKEIALASAPHGPSEFGTPYPGTCRSGPTARGRPLAQRFLLPDTLPEFSDPLLEPGFEVARGDFVVRRADGLFSYQLAVVVDDAAMQISEVVRGADLAGCTPWQLALFDALGADRPAFVHVPLVLGPDGKRLAKREGGLSIAELRARGHAPERVVGLLARSAGLIDRDEAVAARELVSSFALQKLSRAAYVITNEPLGRA